jgi:7-cyano-7-deazaguanine synthase
VSDNAVVLLSGGLDSATTLAIAARDGYACHCLSFDYGQRHASEIRYAEQIASRLGAKSHHVVRLDMGSLGGSALTDRGIALPTDGVKPGIPVTYVPARNTVFLAYALAFAEVSGAADIYIGVNAVDYSGYPDCRPEFIAAFEHLANVATRAGVEGQRITIRVPLIRLSKADIIRRGIELGVEFGMTVSCYQLDDEGRACRFCDSCRIRRAGFEQAGVPDPTRYR